MPSVILAKSKPQSKIGSKLGVYLHIPFCSFSCHYCDFVKTSRFDEDLTSSFFNQLKADLEGWLDKIEKHNPHGFEVSSIYLGGGTPGLFSEEYQSILKKLLSKSSRPIEVTLEANPNDISIQKLDTWREMGVNRLSLGLQSFQAEGLNYLTRDHDSSQSLKAIKMLQDKNWTYSFDLIYGWHGQDGKKWSLDLEHIEKIRPDHVSMYNLSYEANTPLLRSKLRKNIPDQPDLDFELYSQACAFMKRLGYIHYELASWAKSESNLAQHNSSYWRDCYFVGVGPGAYGWFPKSFDLSSSRFQSLDTQRYHYTKNINQYCQESHKPNEIFWEQADLRAKIIDKIGCSLRTRSGVDISDLTTILKRNFVMSPIIQQGIENGGLTWNVGGNLIFSELEWFRENAWVSELVDGFS